MGDAVARAGGGVVWREGEGGEGESRSDGRRRISWASNNIARRRRTRTARETQHWRWHWRRAGWRRGAAIHDRCSQQGQLGQHGQPARPASLPGWCGRRRASGVGQWARARAEGRGRRCLQQPTVTGAGCGERGETRRDSRRGETTGAHGGEARRDSNRDGLVGMPRRRFAMLAIGIARAPDPVRAYLSRYCGDSHCEPPTAESCVHTYLSIPRGTNSPCAASGRPPAV